jgi:carboxypeptidase PM20D1
MLKRIVFVVIGILVFLIAVLTIRTILFKSAEFATTPEPIEVGNYENMASNLSRAIQFQTVSNEDASLMDSTQFLGFIDFLKEKYPLTHQHLKLDKINELGLLYRWRGQPESDRLPILLAAHYDVVPADEDPEGEWKYPPFSGEIAEGYLWGRGALDNKQSVIGIMEAIENLLTRGFQPNRDIYIAFGHDEEVGGMSGARAMADWLEQREIKLEFVLDEGLAVTRGLVPGVERDVAMIGVSEKGFVTIKLTLTATGGHSAMPGKRTTIGKMSEAIVRLEENQMDARLIPPVRKFLKSVAVESGFMTRMVFANLWLFEGLVLRQLTNEPLMSSMVRTTTAPTIIQSGSKANVISNRAEAYINFRMLPGETTEDVVNHVQNLVDAPGFEVEVIDFFAEPSPVSSSDSDAFIAIGTAISEIFPDVIVTPNLMNAVADARHYTDVAENVYRFAPMVITREYLKTIHGTDERIPVSDLNNIPTFFERLIVNSSGVEEEEES